MLRSQWIPENEALWSIDRYPEFLEARRCLLAVAANEMLENLEAGREAAHTDLPSPAAGSLVAAAPAAEGPTREDEDDPEVVAMIALAADLAIAAPESHHEICDHETGEVLAVADIAWPQGIQTGRTEPVALLLAPDPMAEAHLGERGYRFFTSTRRLIWHLEELLGVDIDGDQVIGEVEVEEITSDL